MRQMYVNEQTKLKNSYTGSKHDTNRGARIIKRVERSARRLSAKTGGLLMPHKYPTHVARELRICMGWLRLFEVIVSGDPHLARRSCPR
jgi:hypothetical protein